MALAGFMTLEDLRREFAAVIHKGDDLHKAWDEVLPACLNQALNEIYAALGGKGYSKAQIASWDRGYEFQRKLAIYWALTHWAVIERSQYQWEGIDMFNCRKMLYSDDLNVLVDGEFEFPDNDIGQAKVGELDHSGDMFGAWADSEDPRLGGPTKT